MVLALVNACVKPVAPLQSLRAAGVDSLVCMLSNCGQQIAACLLDESCRAALTCLNSCGPTDQVGRGGGRGKEEGGSQDSATCMMAREGACSRMACGDSISDVLISPFYPPPRLPQSPSLSCPSSPLSTHRGVPLLLHCVLQRSPCVSGLLLCVLYGHNCSLGQLKPFPSDLSSPLLHPPPLHQVCSYRCIVSYESPLLEAFSLCVLQKHNCLRLDAAIRDRPNVQPLPEFRGQPLTFDAAEDIFIGWLPQEQSAGSDSGNRRAEDGAGEWEPEVQWSWRVVAGQNAAYDQFPCQYQIFYRGKARGTMWYDPVFTVGEGAIERADGWMDVMVRK